MTSAARALVRWLFWPNTVLLFSLASAVWIESDLYRYFILIILLEGILVYYLRHDRPSIGPMGFLCALWGIHVGLRLTYGLYIEGDLFQGSSEGIYLFALVYPTLGYALYVHRLEALEFARVFIGLSLLALLASVDLPAIVAGERVAFLFHTNTIHASVGGGFILIAAFCFLIHLMRNFQEDIHSSTRLVWIAMAVATIVLCALGILGAKSKGVWLSIAATMPFLVAAAVCGMERRRQLVFMAASTLGAAVLIGLFRYEISAELWPNAVGAADIAFAAAASRNPLETLELMIAGGSIPSTFNQRLMLWVNALEVWASAPVWGAGVEWIERWQETTYADSPYTIVHNGFLEIAVRYGLIGLAFYGFSTLWSIRQAWICRRRGLIADPAFILYAGANLFFALTLLTNSNNRLAIGESFMLLSGGFGFYCYFLLRDHERGPTLSADERAGGFPGDVKA